MAILISSPEGFPRTRCCSGVRAERSVVPRRLPPSNFFKVEAAVGDFNQDGDPDIAVLGNGVEIYLGGPGASFQPPTPIAVGSTPFAIAIGDFNADGDPDLAVAHRFNPSYIAILAGGPGGTFSAATTLTRGRMSPGT